jgi:serine/threonine protein kinase
VFKFLCNLQDYFLVQIIGKETFGNVYKTELNIKDTAIKQISLTSYFEERDIAQLQREINSTAFFQHENIIFLLDFFCDDKNFYLVFDYCLHGNLYNLTARKGINSDIHAAKIFYQIVSAIQYCHLRGVAHRNLKSKNILLDGTEHIKVSDFGFCGHFAEC